MRHLISPTRMHENGKSRRTEIETGVSDGLRMDVTSRRVAGSREEDGSEAPWMAIDGSEQVILGDLSILTDGGPVRIAPAKGAEYVVEADSRRPAANRD